MRLSRSFVLLWMIWTANYDAYRFNAHKTAVAKYNEQVRQQAFSNAVVATNAQNQTQILCFGLCIAALGGVGLFFLIGAGGAATVSIGYAARAVIDHLSEEGVEASQIKKTVALAAAWAKIPLEEVDAEQDRVHREAVTPVSWTSTAFLNHIWSSCGKYMEAKGLGDSASSSKSGAVFFNCESPPPQDEFPRMLVKGAIRDTDSSPEWQNFLSLSQDPGLQARYSNPTLLNKIVLGFDAYKLHWLVLEDVKATRVLYQLQHKLNINILEKDMPKFDSFDIKPAGSRAPQLPGCLQRLEALSTVFGPIHEFKGWDRIEATLELDLELLKLHHIIDESLFVQIAGPFDVDENAVNAAGESKVLEVLGGTPMCAYQVNGGKMAVVCVAILDYVLSMSFMKSVQNVFQFSRWDDYEGKMQTLLSCLGDLTQERCNDFDLMSTGKWLEIVTADYAEHYKKTPFKNSMNHLESNYRCCCNIKETKDTLTMATACMWLSRKDQVTAMGYCPSDLQHYSAANGGCMDVEPPPLPPPPPASRCSFYHSCCCYDRDYQGHLPSTANGLCSCMFSCPGSYHSYVPKTYCPNIFSS